MYLDLGDCSDKWLYGCLFLVHNKAYLRAVFILIWDQTIVCWWAWPSFFFSPDVNFYFFNSTCLLLPIHLPHASMLWSCDTMDCSPPGSFVRGIFQARILDTGCHFLHPWPSFLDWRPSAIKKNHSLWDLSGKDSKGQHLPPQMGACHILFFSSHLGSNKQGFVEREGTLPLIPTSGVAYLSE